MKRNDLAGTKQVYGFTLRQLLRSKANIISLLVLLLVALASVPVMSLLNAQGHEEAEPETIFQSADVVYVVNDTELRLDTAALAAAWPNTEFYFEAPTEADAVCVRLSALTEGYSVDVSGPWDAALLSLLGDTFSTLLTKANAIAAGADEAAMDRLLGGFTLTLGDLSEYNGAQAEEGADFATTFTVQYLYSILVLILCVLSTSFILQSIVEEKNSKLVELLLVSVAPLSLILGKILAVMTYIFLTIALLCGGMGLSYFVTGMFMDVSGTLNLFGSFNFSALQLSPMVILIVLVSLLLGYLTFSLMGGIAGSSCSSMEDVQTANMSVVLLVLAAYMFATVAASAESQSLCVASALIPLVSVFCAPTQYVLGNIGLGLLLLSWALQIGLIALLAVFSARVYKALILHKGARVRLKQLLSIARKTKREEAAIS